MANVKNVTHYSKNAHGQPNVNQADADSRVNWENPANASASDYEKSPKGSSTSSYVHVPQTLTISAKKKKMPYDAKPYNFTGHDFGLNIPKCAYIKNIKFTVRMKVSGNIDVELPYARFNMYKGTKSVKDNIKDYNGWSDGNYYHRATNYNKLTNSWRNVTYEMSGTEFRKRGYSIENTLNQEIMGIDLRFFDPKTIKTNTCIVSIQYIQCHVDYEMADNKVTFDRTTSEARPYTTYAGQRYYISATYKNNSNAKCCDNNLNVQNNLEIKVTLPPNTKILMTEGDYDIATNTWSVPCEANATRKLGLELVGYGLGKSPINFYNKDGINNNYWIYSASNFHDVGEVTPYPEDMQEGVKSCVKFISKVNSRDGVATFNINMDTVNNTHPHVEWKVAEGSDDGVTLKSDSCTDSVAAFNVPRDEIVDVVFYGCFVPTFHGDSRVSVNLDGGDNSYANYDCWNVPVFVVRNVPDPSDRDVISVGEITFRPSHINFVSHRIASSTEIGAYVLDCGVADYDSNMIVDNCTLTANIWQKLNYIGCVPLKFSHYDPESTYSNKGISESYKNKTYKGKEGIIDEKITLKFKTQPKNVTTLQGLVKLDKPTPINANWRCFEGDALNHRGWVVLSEIKAKKVNPLYYDVEADVDYITHDINTKFQIFKGDKVNSQNMPQLMAETFELGDNLSTALDVFDVITDGGFIYDDESEEGVNNLFSLDEGEKLSISTRKALADVSQIRFDWYSNLISETRENNMERIFRIKDADGNSILEYEYVNFQFNDGDFVSCDVIIRVLSDDGGWTPLNPLDISLKTEIEADPIADDGEDEEEVVPDEEESSEEEVPSEEEDEEPAYEEGYIAPSFNPQEYEITTVYGSSLELTINGNKLTIHDAGFNGREVEEEIELIKSTSYKFECAWTNKNHDGTTDDVISYIDVGLSETILSAQYEKIYNNLIVSPFPIPDKKVVFTRESEEGTIYYLTGEEPFKYRLEPYYQYHCGCDLVTREGISIFDLDNSYTYFYIENGLVRLGFNKYNARMYLAKYDILSKEWVTTHYFHMSNDIKFSLQEYSDDKIVIKAGTNTFFTIWRGHPFIGIRNPEDNIYFDTNFNYCLSDRIDGNDYPYPTILSFMNEHNLLPECIGGKKIDYDCISIDDDQHSTGTPHDLTISIPTVSPSGTNTTINATLSPATTDGEVHYLVDDIDVGSASSPFTFNYPFESPKEYVVQAVYVGDDDDCVAISPKLTIKVPTPPIQNDPHPTISGHYNLKILSAPKKMTYRDKSKVVVQLLKGQTPIPNEIIELQLPTGHTNTRPTKGDGTYTILNDDQRYVPDKYQWGARFYDPNDEDEDKKPIYTALKWITVDKATPTFTNNSVDGKVNKGKVLVVKLNGVDAIENPKHYGLEDKVITYTLNGGSKKSKTTSKKGTIHIPFNTIGTYKLKLMFAGSPRYKSISKTITIKVV